LTLWFPLLIWWTPLCRMLQIMTRRFTLYAYAEVNSDGTAKASYTLNLGIIRNGIKYNTGFGMSIEPSGGSYKSTVVFAADQFGIYSGSDPGNYQAAFFVYNGQVFIRSAFIQDGSVDNAKIGNFIQSNDYVAGSQGWRIDKNGTFEINGVAGGGRMRISSTLIQIYDSNNVLRVRMGLW
ncbi:DUF1983 domain-containing protein, partial [Enterobacter asburiae]|uniref:phage tail tip fiber protein n=1 Tax=Enterobacter asburiae TaxID=61645 RepID=UPI0028791846